VADDAAMLLIDAWQKPGTSSKVMIGMLKQSQKRTKRAPSRSRQCRAPRQVSGWFATMPTE
jgi:hypothetical protein